jgi:hypothetical protein
MVLIMAIVGLVIIYLGLACGKLNGDLYYSGLTDSTQFLSFRKIKRASRLVKSKDQARMIKNCLIFHSAYVVLLWGMVVFILYDIFFKN